MCSSRVGRSKRPRSGSRSTRRRCASGETGSSPKATLGCWTGRVGRIGHRTGPPGRVERRGAAAASEASVGRGSHRVRGRPRRRRRCSAILRSRGAAVVSIAVTGRPTPSPVPRYQRERPGELIHVDVKKIAGDPRRGRLAGPRRGHGSTVADQVSATATSTPPSMTAPASSTPRSSTTNKAPPPRRSGSAPPLVRVDRHHLRTCPHRQRRLLQVASSGTAPATTTGTTVKKTRPRRPQTNGKVERFHRILLEEWAYIRPWTSEPNAPPATTHSSTSTITTDPTAHSDGQHPPAPSQTTSPRSTPRHEVLCREEAVVAHEVQLRSNRHRLPE